MKTTTTQKTGLQISRFLYPAFLLASAFFMLIKHEAESALFYFCIALVFDPFDQNVEWKQRPRYQQIWLYAHFALALTGGVFILWSGNKL